VETARRPRYGGTLRVEIGAKVSSLDPAVAAANSEEAAAKAQLAALTYDHRNPDKTFAGAGAFRISAWEAGKSVTLAANDDYRSGRPFVDSIEIQMGRSARDRLLDLELNKTDLAEISPEQGRHAGERGVRISTSQPDELLALFRERTPGRRRRARARSHSACDRPRRNCEFYSAKNGRTCRWDPASVVEWNRVPVFGSARYFASEGTVLTNHSFASIAVGI